ncbi:hypothetical protein GS429_18035 [Natronorubrum sp. JWXQ-INN-674]|uniref:Winged helix-turn helix domain-containing protein n=1 Tax=Natronorubrum halalkaliphilum TaxID=2691917 RepID=A0A6B0VSG8_9EURY|nr:hypothetical protein [Natronorubrum halalkaliphilum]
MKKLEQKYDVEYSVLCCRRLLKEQRLSYQKPRRTVAEPEAEGQDLFREVLKNGGE